ncbi:uncharacterized protein [Centruroides vittatus]|uniref:uncharacterized protein n=1 Tax=Centruroides vittatus TaxID=120091 RepID=UPI00350E9ECC
MDSKEKGFLLTLFFITNWCLIDARLVNGIFQNNHEAPKWPYKNALDSPLSINYKTPHHKNYNVPPIVKNYPKYNDQNRELSWIMNYYPLMKSDRNDDDDYYNLDDGSPEMPWLNNDYSYFGDDDSYLNKGIFLNSNLKIPKNASQVIHHFILEIPHNLFEGDNTKSKNQNLTDDLCMAKILYPLFEGRRGNNMIIGYMDHRVMMNPGMINTELSENMYNSSLFYQNYANLYHNFTRTMILNHKKLPLYLDIAHKKVFIGYLHHLILNATSYAMLNRNLYMEQILKQYPNMDNNLMQRLHNEMQQSSLTNMHHVLVNLPYPDNYEEFLRDRYPLQLYQGYQTIVNGMNWNGYPAQNTRVAFYLHHPLSIPNWYNMNENTGNDNEPYLQRYLSALSDDIAHKHNFLLNQPQQHNAVAYNYWLQNNDVPNNQYFTKIILHYYIPLSKTLLSMNKLKEILRRKQEWWRHNRERNNREPLTSEMPDKDSWEFATEKIIEQETSSEPTNIEEILEELKEKQEEKLMQNIWEPTGQETSSEPTNIEDIIKEWKDEQEEKSTPNIWEPTGQETSSEPTNIQEILEELKEEQEEKSTPNIWEPTGQETSSEPTNIQEILEGIERRTRREIDTEHMGTDRTRNVE